MSLRSRFTRVGLADRGVTGAWNFGPPDEDFRSVKHLLETVETALGVDLRQSISVDEPEEAGYLALDSSKAVDELKWQPKFSFERAVAMSIVEIDSTQPNLLGETVRTQVVKHTEHHSQTKGLGLQTYGEGREAGLG